MGQITRLEYKTNEEWLTLRTSLDDRLGGSDLGVAAKHSPYKSPYRLFCEHVGLLQPEDISEREAIIQGHDLEGYVAERFTRLTGKKVHPELCIFTNSDAPHLKASIDRKLDDEDSGLECKTVKDFVMKKFKHGDFPQTYYDQCACYLKVTELKRWYLAMLVFGTEFKVFLMTTIKEEDERYNELKLKLIEGRELTDEELTEWNSKYAFLESCYYISQEELDGCEVIASTFIDRCNRYVSGDVSAWPLEEIDGSDCTNATLRLINPKPIEESVVTFDDASEYGISADGQPYVKARRKTVQDIVDRRIKINEVIAQLEIESDMLDNQLAVLMEKQETFELPNAKVTYKVITPRRTASVAKVEEYFAAKKEDVPAGMISTSAVSRGIRVYPHKAKSEKKQKSRKAQ